MRFEPRGCEIFPRFNVTVVKSAEMSGNRQVIAKNTHVIHVCTYNSTYIHVCTCMYRHVTYMYDPLHVLFWTLQPLFNCQFCPFRRLLHFYPLRAVNCLNLGKVCPISQSTDLRGYTFRLFAGPTTQDSTANSFKMGRKHVFRLYHYPRGRWPRATGQPTVRLQTTRRIGQG